MGRYDGSCWRSRISRYNLKDGKKYNEISETDKKKLNSRFFKLLVTFWLVKKFTRTLRENTFYRKPQWLKNFHLKIINDLVFFNEGRSYTKKTTFLNHIKSKIIRHVFITLLSQWIVKIFHIIIKKLKKTLLINIHPTNKFRLIWEFLVTLMTCFFLIIIPIEIGFDDVELIFGFFFKFIALMIFFLDMAINFNTSFYSREQLINSKKKILRNYFYGRFLKDFFSISFLILIYFFGYSSNDFLVKISGFLYLLRMQNLSKAISRFEDFCFSDETTSNLISFIRLILNILIFSHWSACVWKLVGNYDLEHGWLAVYNVKSQNTLEQYIYSLYYVVVVTNTVGFGDITPQTIYEKAFTIFFIYVACVIFAYTINRIGMILQNINKKENEFKKMMNTINGYMKFKNIDFDLKIKVRNYLEYIWQAEKMQNISATQEIINRLSKSLKEEVLLMANTLDEIPWLRKNFSEESVRKIICEMKEINFTPEDVIYNEKDLNNENFFIIHDGEIELFIETPNNSKNISLKTLKKGDHFGEISFFTGVPRTTGAKSLSFSSVFFIKKESFVKIIKENNEDYEKFCKLKDEISLYKEFGGIFNKCLSCQKTSHLVMDCPLLHLTLNPERVLEKYNFSTPHERRSSFIRKRKSFPCLKNFIETRQLAKKMCITMQNIDSTDEMIESMEINNKFFSENEFKRKSEDVVEEEDNEDYLLQKQNKGRALSFESVPDGTTSEVWEKTNEKSIVILDEPKISSSFYAKKNNPNKVNFKEEEEGPSLKEKYLKKRLIDRNLVKIKSTDSLVSNNNKSTAETVDIDCGKNYEFYFPNNNIDDFIETINQLALKKLKKLRNFFSFHFERNSKLIKSSFFFKPKNKKSTHNQTTLKISKKFFKKDIETWSHIKVFCQNFQKWIC